MRRLILPVLLLALPGMALAGNGKEARNNQQERHQNNQQQADDKKDHHDLVRIITDWNRARAEGDKNLERDSDKRLEHWIKAELVETKQEAKQADKEARGSEAEARGERREASNADNRRQAADGYRDAADDHRDAADDRQDARQAHKHHERTKAIALELRDMHPKFVENKATDADYTRKAGLLGELERMARGEKAENREEKREDAGERREDQQERKEDRRRR